MVLFVIGKNMVYFVLDIVYIILHTYILWDKTIFYFHLFCVIFCAILIPKCNKYALTCCLVVRYLGISVVLGEDNSQLFFLLSIVYVEMILSEVKYFNALVTTPIFAALMIGNYKNIGIHDLDPIYLNYTNYAGILTRLYVFTYLIFLNLIFKHDETQYERILSEEAHLLKVSQSDEVRFMSKFSHFSRTSLHGIVNSLIFLRKRISHLLSLLPTEEKDIRDLEICIDTIETSCFEINGQTTDLVEYYMIRNGIFQKSRKTNMEPVHLEKLVNFVVRVQKRLRLDSDPAKSRKLGLNVFVDPKLPQFILQDRRLLIKILTNTISNAVKYTDEGCVSINVFPTNHPSQDKVVVNFRIIDTGIGIDEDMLGRVFDPFVPAKEENKRDSFSIGLVITKSIVEILEGKLEITSAGKRRGTEVNISIPCTIVDTPPEECEENDHEVLEEGLTDVLIVEDNLINQQVFRKQVEDIVNDNRVHIHQALNGREALLMLDRGLHLRNPLVLCDINMPVCDGIRFCRILRKQRGYGHRLVVYSLTATITGNEEEFCKMHMFDGTTQKPLYPADMTKIIKFMNKVRNERMENVDYQLNLMDPNEKLIFGSESFGDETKRILKEEEEEEDEEKKQQQQSEDEQKRLLELVAETKEAEKLKYIQDMFIALVISAAQFLLLRVCPEELYVGWYHYFRNFFFSSIAQYIIVFSFGLSSQTCAIVNVIRSLLVAVIAYEEAYLKTSRMADMAHIGFITQACASIESFSSVLLIIVLFIIHVYFYEIFFPMILVGSEEQQDVMTRNRGFLDKLEKVAYAVFLLFIVGLTVQFKQLVKEKKLRWKKIIEEKNLIERDINMTTAKISHDLATPASAVVLYLLELKSLLEKNTSTLKSFNAKKIVDRKEEEEEEGEGDEDLFEIGSSRFEDKMIQEYFVMMMASSLGLEMSIHNFLICCKVKNKMISAIPCHGVNIKELVNEILERCYVLKPDQTDVLTTFSPDLEVLEYTIDAQLTRLIITNLVINSFVHSGASRISVVCFTNDHETENIFTIDIADDGIGISMKTIAFVNSLESLEKFYFRERFSNALGLGLVVCKLLVEQLAGELTIYSCHDGSIKNGSRVLITFPYQVRTMAPLKEAESDLESKLPIAFSEDRYSILKKKKVDEVKVLCMDDCPVLVRFVEKFMQELGFRSIVTTCHEWEFLQMVQQEKFDILVTDYNLSSMNCVDLIHMITDQNNLPLVTVCITGNPEDVVDQGEIIDAVIAKPLYIPNLRHTMSRFVNLR